MGTDRTPHPPDSEWPEWWHDGKLGDGEQLRELVHRLLAYTQNSEAYLLARLREAEAEHSETYKLYREALKDNADFAMRADRLEAELREAQEIVGPFAATWGRMVDDDDLFRPPTDQSLYRKAWHWLDRARGVLENRGG